MLLFPDLTAQDFIGPYDVFIRATDHFDVLIVSETTDIIRAEGGLQLKADLTLDDCPIVDILFVPGGKGINALLTSKKYIDFLQRQGKQAKYITSVCTGSLVLATAGLLNGYKATTHWRSLDLLRLFNNVEVREERVVIDRNRVTGGGVTAGIDFGLTLTSKLCGEDCAKMIQLALEYNPDPPFQAGSPQTAEEYILKKVKEKSQPVFDHRLGLIGEIKQL